MRVRLLDHHQTEHTLQTTMCTPEDHLCIDSNHSVRSISKCSAGVNRKVSNDAFQRLHLPLEMKLILLRINSDKPSFDSEIHEFSKAHSTANLE